MYEYNMNTTNGAYVTKYRAKTVTTTKRYFDETGNMVSEEITETITQEPYQEWQPYTWTSGSGITFTTNGNK